MLRQRNGMLPARMRQGHGALGDVAIMRTLDVPIDLSVELIGVSFAVGSRYAMKTLLGAGLFDRGYERLDLIVG